jgi:hypothetical protein
MLHFREIEMICIGVAANFVEKRSVNTDTSSSSCLRFTRRKNSWFLERLLDRQTREFCSLKLPLAARRRAWPSEIASYIFICESSRKEQRITGKLDSCPGLKRFASLRQPFD